MHQANREAVFAWLGACNRKPKAELLLFCGCTKFNQKVAIPDSVEICWRMFQDCKAFNQSVSIPDSVINTKEMFQGCAVFNQKVKLSNRVSDGSGMFADCEMLNQPVELPAVMDNCGGMFRGCRRLNQPMIIPESVTFTAEMFKDCEKLNQPIELCVTSSLYCDDMFVNTPSLQKRNVTIYCTKAGRKNLDRILKKMWRAEPLADKTNICLKNPKKKSESVSAITKVSCFMTEKEHWEMAQEELADCSVDAVFEKIESCLERQGGVLLEIEEKSKNSAMCLSVHGEGGLYAIGIVDEWNDHVFYYNSGKSDDDVEIRGKIYPGYMVSGDQKVVRGIVKDFLKSGKPSKKVKWTN